MESSLNKNINLATVSLEYIHQDNKDIDKKMEKIKNDKFLLTVQTNNKKNELNEFLKRKDILLQEIEKGEQLIKIMNQNNNILDKLYNL